MQPLYHEARRPRRSHRYVLQAFCTHGSKPTYSPLYLLLPKQIKLLNYKLLLHPGSSHTILVLSAPLAAQLSAPLADKTH